MEGCARAALSNPAVAVQGITSGSCPPSAGQDASPQLLPVLSWPQNVYKHTWVSLCHLHIKSERKRPPPRWQGTASRPLANRAAVTPALNWFTSKIIRAFLGVGKGRVWIQVVARRHEQFYKNSWRKAQWNVSPRFSTVSGIWKLNSWRQMLDTGGCIIL